MDHPPKRQRIAAYAVIRREAADGEPEILLARIAPRIAADRWTLPGGGIDHGEHPRDAVRREVLEETGLHVEPGQILDVWSNHYTGPRPDGVVEDYHGIGLVFSAEILAASQGVEPRVLDVGGSTSEARWFRASEAAGLQLGAARLALSLLETPAPGVPS